MKKLLAGLVLVLIGAAFVAGYWLQRERLIAAQAQGAELQRQLSQARAQLAEAEAKARIGALFGQFLALKDAVVSGNFGEAQGSSSAFFDLVREEASAADDPATRKALEAVLSRRDAVTAGLARGESSVRELLSPVERELRGAFGYPAPPQPATQPAATPDGVTAPPPATP